MLNSKKVLFVLAHYDDESFSAGTIKKMVDAGIEVSVLIICGNGAVLNDPRRNIFSKNIEHVLQCQAGAIGYFDLTLNNLSNDVRMKMEESVRDYIYSYAPDTIITNNSTDLHNDHKFVSEMVRIISRPSQEHNIKNLYECYIPGATEYGAGTNEFTCIVNVSNELPYRDTCIGNYDLPHRGLTNQAGARITAQYFGALNSCHAAEIFKPIYTKQ